MGPAVGIKTEFWEFPGKDFGADLNQWTSNLTTVEGVPLVHSVSCRLRIAHAHHNVIIRAAPERVWYVCSRRLAG